MPQLKAGQAKMRNLITRVWDRKKKVFKKRS